MALLVCTANKTKYLENSHKNIELEFAFSKAPG